MIRKLFVFAILINITCVCYAQWEVVGDMLEPRTEHTATCLTQTSNNLIKGRVLVTGGYVSVGGGTITEYLNSAEFYDPTTKLWFSANPMTTSRTKHTATELPNGKVLIVGGIGSDGNALSSTELYDPTNNSWTQTSPMNSPRARHTATLLSNGKVLVAGGTTGTGQCLDNADPCQNAELYDPDKNTWTIVSQKMIERHVGHTATIVSSSLNSTVVLIVGGSYNNTLFGAETYNSTSGQWTPTGSMNVLRSGHTATLLQDGSVLVAGGCYANPDDGCKNANPNLSNYVTSSAEIYKYNTNSTWKRISPMICTRTRHVSVLTPDNKVLVMGGEDEYGTILASSELYDPTHDICGWLETESMPTTARADHTAVNFTKNKDKNFLLVCGGENTANDGTQQILSSAEIFDPSSESKFLCNSASVSKLSLGAVAMGSITAILGL